MPRALLSVSDKTGIDEVARGLAILRYFAQAALLPDGDTLPAASPGALLMARAMVQAARPAQGE